MFQSKHRAVKTIAYKLATLARTAKFVELLFHFFTKRYPVIDMPPGMLVEGGRITSGLILHHIRFDVPLHPEGSFTLRFSSFVCQGK